MQQPLELDTGLVGLSHIARFHDIAVNTGQLRHVYGQNNAPLNENDLLRAARSIGLKAKPIKTSLSRLTNGCLPALAHDNKNGFFILARITQDGKDNSISALVHDPREPNPKRLTEKELETLWTGSLILLTRRQTPFQATPRQFNFSWFIPALVKYRKIFAEVIIASFFLQLFALVTPLFFQVIMDKVLVHKGFTTLDVLAFGFLVIALFGALLGGLRNYLFAHTSNRVDVELGASLFDHLMALPLAYFETRQVGQSVARVRELETIRNFITGSALTLLIDLSFTFVFFGVMWYYSPLLTLIVLGSIPFYAALSIVITPILRRRLDQKFRYGAENQAFLVESVTGIETVKSMAVEPQMQRNWEDQLARYITASFGSQNLSNIAGQVAGLINKITTLLIIWWGAHQVIAGELSVGQLIAFNMLAGQVSGPILKLVQLWQDFQQAGISMDRLGDILNTAREPGYNPNRSTLPAVRGQVTFDRVCFRYRPEAPPVLDIIELNVHPGEVIGIVGKSGSGKSTLGKLIQRLHVPQQGRVMIDGVDLAMVDTAWLRRNIGVVLQDNFLFNRTVRDHIALAQPGVPMEAVLRAARLAGAHDFILELGEGYDTLVGEHGCNLSGGQRQRIAIARALITNPRIVIFDEATSALDYESERIIQNNMAAISQNRTVFIIAHRLTTVRHCDRIITMEKGKIIESGNHQKLIAENGYYALLHSYQNQIPPIKPLDGQCQNAYANSSKKARPAQSSKQN